MLISWDVSNIVVNIVLGTTENIRDTLVEYQMG